jgi:uncharacterized protein YbaR (Trm112 family)
MDMIPAVLEFLVSPVHHHPLSLTVRHSESSLSVNEIQEGDLVDRVIGDRFPIIEGVPFLQPGSSHARTVFLFVKDQG